MNISIEYTKEHSKVKKFEDDPILYLINQYHNKAESVRYRLERGEIQSNLK